MILLGLTGRAGSGKSTVARYLCEQHGFDELALATPIKQGLALMLRELGLSLEDLDDPARKQRVLEPLGRTPRELLQTLGTEWGRHLVHEDLWIKVCEARLAAFGYAPAVVISDVRFANEAAWIRRRGGRVWAVIRPSASSCYPDHASEIGLPSGAIDDYLLNDATLPALHAFVDRSVSEKIE